MFWSKKEKTKKEVQEWEKYDSNTIATKTAVQASVELSDVLSYKSTLDDIYKAVKGALLHEDIRGGCTTSWIMRSLPINLALLKSIKELNERIEKLESECNKNQKI